MWCFPTNHIWRFWRRLQHIVPTNRNSGTSHYASAEYCILECHRLRLRITTSAEFGQCGDRMDDVLHTVTLVFLHVVPNSIYQQDETKAHTACTSQHSPQDTQVFTLLCLWLLVSPDLSPIEHIWDMIGRRFRVLLPLGSDDKLWQIVNKKEHLSLKTQSTLFLRLYLDVLLSVSPNMWSYNLLSMLYSFISGSRFDKCKHLLFVMISLFIVIYCSLSYLSFCQILIFSEPAFMELLFVS